jgi:phosphoribosylanthranilate isomerase
MTRIAVKICGLTRPEHVRASVDAGATYLGFNFFPKSPRYVTPDTARALALEVPAGVAKVALVVDADDPELDDILARAPFDMIQLHGHESPERVAALRQRHGLPVMKVIGVAGPGDMADIARFEAVADQILLDAKPPRGAVLPGGNGLSFDWQLVAARKVWRRPWMLAGGLTPGNVADAIRLTGARQVDVSSGVESAPGVKDGDLVRAFIAAARSV